MGRIQQGFGVIMILAAVAIYANVDKSLQVKLLNAFPAFSTSLNRFESAETVKQGLNLLKTARKNNEGFDPPAYKSDLPVLSRARDFVGITRWLNTSAPLSLAQLRGKVVLVDFWTYTCINCIRTLPHVTSWYDKYKDQGFVVIGVHTPEFEFEKETSNVENAIRQYQIHYPVAQDNEYKTWLAYDNQYWPAEYLIDAEGNIRHAHFGEGEYEETEMAIRKLLSEQGENVSGQNVSRIAAETPQYAITPETYLGSARMERFSSQEEISGGFQRFTLPGKIPAHHFAFDGIWKITPQAAVADQGSALEMRFISSKLFLVMTPKGSGERIRVFLDGQPIGAAQSGGDVKNSEVILDHARLYHLVDLKRRPEQHLLRLEFQNPGISIFAFTFG